MKFDDVECADRDDGKVRSNDRHFRSDDQFDRTRETGTTIDETYEKKDLPQSF